MMADKYKTVLCKHFANGRCDYGNNCVFAHGPEDLRVKSRTRKTVICKYYLQGTCRFGKKCRFAHGNRDLHHYNKVAVVDQPNIQNQNEVDNSTMPTVLVITPSQSPTDPQPVVQVLGVAHENRRAISSFYNHTTDCQKIPISSLNEDELIKKLHEQLAKCPVIEKQDLLNLLQKIK